MVPKRSGRSLTLIAVVAVLLVLAFAPAAFAQWQIESKDGSTSIKFGFLAVPRAEFLDSPDGQDTQSNFFFRRFRILFGGKLSEKWSFFFETDSPNMGRTLADGSKNDPDIFIQDLILTYNHSDSLKIDMGMLLIENSYNSNQSAASLLPVDYGPFSFIDNGPLDERVGRDYGMRLRGHVADKKLEYRLGIYDGFRGVGANNPPRFAGRLMYNVYEPQTGLFYQGSSYGTKKILSFGASYDTQSDYDALGVDFYLDMPVGNGNGLTLQADLVNWDGGSYIPAFVEQDTLLVELGYYIKSAKLQPFIQYSERDFDPVGIGDQEQIQVGVGYIMKGHNRHFKVSWTSIETDGGADRDQLWVNFQFFQF